MYQLEVKYQLIRQLFLPSDGWEVVIDVDAMERAIGPQHKSDKKERVSRAEAGLRDIGVRFGEHKKYRRVDIAASHSEKGCYLIEVEASHQSKKNRPCIPLLAKPFS